MIEFGAAEILDTFLLRPLSLYGCSILFGVAGGSFIGSLVADVTFWVTVYAVKKIKKRSLTAAVPAGTAAIVFKPKEPRWGLIVLGSHGWIHLEP
ncbi:hypothetical protein HY311_00225 [Candidatus Nomurabacteria bacterium]|nr:hypothetical protein [Candidatus Nomurabacteria bacterium]